MKLKKGLVVFDFDGVIANTIRADYLTATTAFLAVGRKIKKTKHVEKQFTHLMRFQRIHSDYYVLLSMIASNPAKDFSNTTDKDFEAVKRKFDVSELKKFTDKFLEARGEMIKKKPGLFKRLSFQYKHISKAMLEAREHNYVAIATTRDTRSLKILLKHFGVVMEEKSLITKETTEHKGEQLEELSKRFHVPISRTVLIDDMPKNLQMAINVGSNAILANWNNKMQSRYNWAKKNKILIAETPEKLLDIIKLEGLWNKVYDEFKGSRRSVWNENPTPFFIRLIDFLKDTRIKTIVDAGCGDGRNFEPLIEAGFEVIGVDGAKSALHKCEKLYRTKVKLVHAHLQSLPFETGSLDALMCDHVFTHIKDMDTVLNEFYRILKNNGYALFEFTSPLDSTFGKGIKLSEKEFLQHGVYLRYDTISDIKKMLKDFEILCLTSEHSTDPPHGPGYVRKERHKHHSFFVLAQK